jgi:hypothetical protein
MANLTDIRSSWSAAASEGGLTVYATTDDLPTSGLTSGDQAYVSSSSRFYISNGTGWYNVALINATPSLTISPDGAIALSVTGETTTITLTATDSDYPDSALTFSVDSDGNFGGLATISQDSSVFTITPLSEDSATTTSSTLTFKASDTISFGTGTTEFTLTFKVDNSKYTSLLLQADASSDDNQVDASTNTYTITEAGNTRSTAYSPYHPGGYSNYITAAGNGYVEWTSPPTFSATAWCVETWFKPDGMPSVAVGTSGHWSIFGCWTANASAKEFLVLGGSSGELRFYYSFDGSAAAYVDSTSGKFSANTWVHLALSFDGTNYTLYADGVNVARVANSSQIANTSSPLSFGKSIDGGGVTQTYVTGWYADGRVINGSTLESNNTFPVPTSRIDTSVANTQAVFHNKPHVRQSLTYAGSATIKRDGPYDYLGYTKTDHLGSVYFDGNGDYLNVAGSNLYSLGSVSGEPFTIEFWVNYIASGSTGSGLVTKGTSGSTGSGDILVIDLHNTKYIGCTLDGTYSGYEIASSTILKANIWYHIALVKNASNVYTLYINGEADGTYTATGTISSVSNFYIGTNFYSAGASSRSPQGFISDVRVVSDAVYTSNFAAPTSPLTAITNTELLTCTNKNDIWDVSNGTTYIAKTGTVEALGTKSGWDNNAIYFNGSTSAYLNTVQSDKFVLGTGDFTIEAWVYFNSINDMQSIFDFRTTGTQVAPLLWAHTNNYFYYYINGSTRIQTASNFISASTWYHVAVARSNGVTKMFVDGTQQGSNYADTNNYVAPGAVYMGKSAVSSDHYLNGYLIDPRITKGLARYTGNFTPPTTDFDG